MEHGLQGWLYNVVARTRTDQYIQWQILVGAPYRVFLYQPGIRFSLGTNSKVLSLQHSSVITTSKTIKPQIVLPLIFLDCKSQYYLASSNVCFYLIFLVNNLLCIVICSRLSTISSLQFLRDRNYFYRQRETLLESIEIKRKSR